MSGSSNRGRVVVWLLTLLLVAGSGYVVWRHHGGSAASAGTATPAPAPAPTTAAASGKVIRLAIVNTPVFGGLIGDLIADFEAKSGYKVEVAGGSDVYERARAGEADLVISHLGKAGAREFVLEGLGDWPKTVFSNQAVIVGPKSDPAGVRGLSSAAEAMARIAKTRSPFVDNELPGVDYLTDIIWQQAGRPEKTGWFLQAGVAKGKAMGFANEKQAYAIWGALPFLRYTAKHSPELEILVHDDPLLQRVMAAIVVSKEKFPSANRAGAEAFLAYLLTSATQARISAFRSPGSDHQLWWPAGRHNANEGGED